MFQNLRLPATGGSPARHRARRRHGLLRAAAVLVPLVLAGGLLTTADAAPAARAAKASTLQPTRFGSSVSRNGAEDYPAAKRRISNSYGAPGVMRIFHSGMPSSWQSIRRNLGTGVPLVVSFKASPAAILSGRHDAYLKHWFAHAPKKQRTFWSYYHEPEDNIARGEFTAATYRAAWAHIAKIAKTADNRLLRPTLILMTWTAKPGSHRNWRDYYAKGWIKTIGWDGYNPYEAQGRYATPKEMFNRAYRVTRAAGLGFGIAEFGSQLSVGDSGAKRAAWLKACARYLNARHARFVTYFDAAFEGENDFRLLDSASKTAWRSVVSTQPR